MRFLEYSRRQPLLISTVLLQNLNLVAIRILDEEELRHQGAIAKELLDIRRLKAEFLMPPVLSLQVIHRDGNVAVAVAMGVGFLSIMVDGQFQLGAAFLIQQVDEGETIEWEPRGLLEAERILGKIVLTGPPQEPGSLRVCTSPSFLSSFFGCALKHACKPFRRCLVSALPTAKSSDLPMDRLRTTGTSHGSAMFSANGRRHGGRFSRERPMTMTSLTSKPMTRSRTTVLTALFALSLAMIGGSGTTAAQQPSTQTSPLATEPLPALGPGQAAPGAAVTGSAPGPGNPSTVSGGPPAASKTDNSQEQQGSLLKPGKDAADMEAAAGGRPKSEEQPK